MNIYSVVYRINDMKCCTCIVIAKNEDEAIELVGEMDILGIDNIGKSVKDTSYILTKEQW